jgi:hypothetical protein
MVRSSHVCCSTWSVCAWAGEASEKSGEDSSARKLVKGAAEFMTTLEARFAPTKPSVDSDVGRGTQRTHHLGERTHAARRYSKVALERATERGFRAVAVAARELRQRRFRLAQLAARES